MRAFDFGFGGPAVVILTLAMTGGCIFSADAGSSSGTAIDVGSDGSVGSNEAGEDAGSCGGDASNDCSVKVGGSGISSGQVKPDRISLVETVEEDEFFEVSFEMEGIDGAVGSVRLSAVDTEFGKGRRRRAPKTAERSVSVEGSRITVGGIPYSWFEGVDEEESDFGDFRESFRIEATVTHPDGAKVANRAPVATLEVREVDLEIENFELDPSSVSISTLRMTDRTMTATFEVAYRPEQLAAEIESAGLRIVDGSEMFTANGEFSSSNGGVTLSNIPLTWISGLEVDDTLEFYDVDVTVTDADGREVTVESAGSLTIEE